MKVLALDTATEGCSVALSVDGLIVARFEAVGRSHTERLMPLVREVMDEAGLCFAQLDALVCGVGPGSFAGVRIGVGFTKGIALAIDRPVVGVSSLAMLARPALRAGARQVVCAIDARMDEVYFGAYRADRDGLPEAVLDARVCAPDQVPALGGEWHAVGTGWARYREPMLTATGAQLAAVDSGALPIAEDALAIGLARLRAGEGHDAAELVPVYLRNKVALTLDEQRARRR